MTRMIRKIALLTGPAGQTEADGRPIDQNMNCVKEFTDEEFGAYERAKDALQVFDEDRRLWNVVHMNYVDFEVFLRQVFERWVRGDPTLDIGQASMEIDRRIVNYTSSFVAWLKHMKSRYIKRYKKDSDRTKALLEVLESEDFPYRFVVKYRNHLLHCGQPISNLQLNTKVIDEQSTNMQFDMPVMLKKESLIEGRGKKADIADWPEEIDVRSVLRDAMQWASDLNKNELKKDIAEIEDEVEYVLGLSKHWEGEVGNPCVLEYALDELLRLKRMPVHTLQEIPIKRAEMIIDLKKYISETDD